MLAQTHTYIFKDLMLFVPKCTEKQLRNVCLVNHAHVLGSYIVNVGFTMLYWIFFS